MAWHYEYKDEISFGNAKDIRNGKYLVYDVDTFDYLINNDSWVFLNDAYEEQNWILDQLSNKIESNDGSLIFIPDVKTGFKIDEYYYALSMCEDAEY